MGKPLKIGFDAKRAFLNAAGLGNYSRNTIAAVSKFYPENNYFLFSPQEVSSRFESPKNSTIVMPNSFWWRALKPFWRTYKISGLAQKAELDIYHGLSHELPIGIRKSGIKSVVTIHDLIFIRFPELYKSTDRKIYLRKIKHACQASDKIIAISKQSKNDLVDFFNIKPEKIEVIYQSINPIYFEKGTSEELKSVKEKYTLPAEFMLTVGTIEARKNLKSILRAMELLDEPIPLVVVGKKTKYMETFQPLIHKFENKIIFLHQVNDEDLSRIYQMAKLMLYPSVFEGFGLPVVEAQASGCPVLTSNVSSMPEAGGDGAHYIHPQNYIQMKEGIARLLQDENYRNELIIKGTANALRFTPETYAKQLMTIYNKLHHA